MTMTSMSTAMSMIMRPTAMATRVTITPTTITTVLWRTSPLSSTDSQLSDGAKRRALAIFTALAAAEAKAHGKTPETVMFHEVGAVDSIVDVCSVAICLDDLGIEDIVVESLSEGHGTIRCAHGLMPIPVPAVVNLCQAGNIALTPAPVAGELVTPTGAAIVTALRTSEHLPARYHIEAVGYGAGKRPYEGCSGTLRCLLVDVDA